ncbi:hypothetical protein Pan153_42820 [Gimesia panareensis]|uniref:Carboxypeptidase regulatory-like domain-containing protein n=1 Tax=Gimesia panareensis TaxID=2527978 RepID=A0A518FTE1_9PLAN|nr:carboxypeptidase-like regulatory domain-containing protein [Gimesia panareensis]QDV19616.1 hypothetical protein Pan153_42820 [Gimesia panareensis]
MGLQIRLCFSLFTLLSITLIVGCSSADSDQKQEVRGTVSLNGTPISNGAITLIPISQGTSVGTTISDGKYLIDSENGALPGEYRVEIDSSQPSGKKIRSTVGESMQDEMINVIPDNFNRNSTLKIVIKKEGQNQHDFELQSHSQHAD